VIAFLTKFIYFGTVKIICSDNF